MADEQLKVPERSHDSTCHLCGWQDPVRHRVLVGVVYWREPHGDHPPRIFEAVPRCVDHHACRERVEAAGKTWPVIDGRSIFSVDEHDPTTV